MMVRFVFSSGLVGVWMVRTQLIHVLCLPVVLVDGSVTQDREDVVVDPGTAIARDRE